MEGGFVPALHGVRFSPDFLMEGVLLGSLDELSPWPRVSWRRSFTGTADFEFCSFRVAASASALVEGAPLSFVGRNLALKPGLRVALQFVIAFVLVTVTAGFSLGGRETVLAAASTHKSGRAEESFRPGPLHTVEFDVEEATWSSVDVSPDGRTILFDLLGDIYTVPIGGGAAMPVLTGPDWDQTPRFSPDGKHFAFVSDRDGSFNLWTAGLEGSDLNQISTWRDDFKPGGKDSGLAPVWTHEGELLVQHAGRKGRLIYLFPQNGGPGVELPFGNTGHGVAASPDGRFIYTSGMRRLDRRTGESLSIGAGDRPEVSPDGRLLAYVVTSGRGAVLHIRDLQTGAERELVDSLTPSRGWPEYLLPDYAFTPDSQSIVLSRFGRLTRVNVSSGLLQAIPFRTHVVQHLVAPIRVDRRVDDDADVRARILRWPVVSPDCGVVVYSTLGKLYATNVKTRRTYRLTKSADAEYAPAFSPDGKWVAYITWSDTALGHVMIVPSAGGTPRRLTPHPGRYASPTWSRDGQKIAFVRDTSVARYGIQSRDEVRLELFWISAAGGEQKYVTSIVQDQEGTRSYPVLAFGPDGTRLFYGEHVKLDERQANTESSAFEMNLVSIDLDGTDRIEHLRFPPVDDVVPSPDGRHVAFGRHEEVMVAELPQHLNTPAQLVFDEPTSAVVMVARQGGNYVAWRDVNTVTWGATTNIYQQELGAEHATHLIDIDLRVPRARPKGTIAFTNARLVTMKSAEVPDVIERGTVVVRGNRILSIGPSAEVVVPAEARVVDVAGTTIIPGLDDVHAHIHRAGREIFPQQKWEYVANLAYGVTTTYDPAAPTLDVFGQAEMVETGDMIGPRIYSSGDTIQGELPGQLANILVRSRDEAREIVCRYAKYRPAMLKEYAQPRRDQRQWLAEAAREAGIPITAEGRDRALDLTLVGDGYTAFEHSIRIVPVYDDVIEFIARSGVHITPTLLVSGLEEYFGRREPTDSDPKLRRFTPMQSLAKYQRIRQQPVPADEGWLGLSQTAARIANLGGSVNMGAHGQLNGLGSHWEMWGLVMGGMSNYEALRAATIVPAEKLGFEQDLGSLQVGKLADFLVLDRNPLDDIRNSTAIRYVVANGFVYDAESMTRLWPTRKPLMPFLWQSPSERKQFAAPVPADFESRAISTAAQRDKRPSSLHQGKRRQMIFQPRAAWSLISSRIFAKFSYSLLRPLVIDLKNGKP